MDRGEFLLWLGGIGKLSETQRAQALASLREVGGGVDGQASDERTDAGRGRDRLDGLGDAGHVKVENQGCPHGSGRKIVSWGRSHALARYRCKDCRRTFNALTKTPMARLRKKELWLAHAEAMLEGTSVAKAAQRSGVHYTTAFRWRHRFLGAPALDKPKRLNGIVEADETFILESFKGRRSGLGLAAAQAGRQGQASRPLLRKHSHPRCARSPRRDD